MASDKALFTITTKTEKEDYRKFLHFTAYRKSPKSILMILGLSVCVAFFGVYYGHITNPLYEVLLWIVVVLFVCLGIFFRAERKISQIDYLDKGEPFKAVQHLEFHDKHIMIEDSKTAGPVKVRYEQIQKVVETKDYYYFYLSEKQASVIRKRDIDTTVDVRAFFMKRFQQRFKACKNR